MREKGVRWGGVSGGPGWQNAGTRRQACCLRKSAAARVAERGRQHRAPPEQVGQRACIIRNKPTHEILFIHFHPLGMLG